MEEGRRKKEPSETSFTHNFQKPGLFFTFLVTLSQESLLMSVSVFLYHCN